MLGTDFGRVCLYVCLSDDNFQKPWRRKFIYFAHAANLHELRLKFVYEGHRVKVKVTGAKMVENSYSRNVKPSIGSNSRSTVYRAVMFAYSMGFSGTADRMVLLCHVTESEHA